MRTKTAEKYLEYIKRGANNFTIQDNIDMLIEHMYSYDYLEAFYPEIYAEVICHVSHELFGDEDVQNV